MEVMRFAMDGAKAEARRVRKRALLILPFVTLLGAVFIWWFISERQSGREWYGWGLTAPLLPFVYYLTELIFGKSIPELAEGWDDLAGWQRGLLGFAVVVLCFVIIILIGVVLAFTQ